MAYNADFVTLKLVFTYFSIANKPKLCTQKSGKFALSMPKLYIEVLTIFRLIFMVAKIFGE